MVIQVLIILLKYVVQKDIVILVKIVEVTEYVKLVLRKEDLSDRPPTRESIAYDMSEIIRFYHDAYGIQPVTEQSLRTAVTGLTMFFLKETDAKDKVPYQYRKENQKDFETHQVIISSALDMVEPVISDIKSKNFRLEKNQQQMMMPQQSQMQMPMQQHDDTKKKNFSLFPQKPTKPTVDPNDPYQSSIPLQKRIENLLNSWELVVEWQSGGAEFVNTDDENDLDRFGFDSYLSNHRQIFRFNVVPNILRVYSQGLNLLLIQEKALAVQYGNVQMKEMFQTRNDFQMQP